MKRRGNVVRDARELPLAHEEASAYLRKIEREVLDVEHTLQPLWKLPPSRAFYALLLAVDGFAVTMWTISSRSSSTGTRQFMKMCHEGASIAIRWLHPRLTCEGIASTVSEEDIETAGQFLIHAAAYAQLELLHVAFGKKLFDVCADPVERVIRFVRPHTLAYRWSNLSFSDLSQWDEQGRSEKDDAIEIVGRRIRTAEPLLADGRINYVPIVEMLDEEVLDACWKLAPRDLIGLRDDESMGAFTFDEFRAYWRAFHAWSFVATQWYVHLFSKGVSQSSCMPTQIVNEAEFFRWIKRLSGLADDTIRAISEFLTYDRRTKRPDVFLQPQFRINGKMVWSPLMVSLSRQPRNAVKLICRTEATQDFGATLNGTRERLLLNRFGQYLQRRQGYDFKLNVVLREGNEESEVDVLAYRRAVPNEVLLVQGKTPIAADEQNEIDSVTKDLEAAARQCSECERMLRGMSLERKQSLYPFVRWNCVDSYFGLVITPDSEPNAHYDHSLYPAISLVTLETRLHPNKLKRPGKLWEECRLKKWHQSQMSKTEGYEEVRVGNVVYQLPIYLEKARS